MKKALLLVVTLGVVGVAFFGFLPRRTRPVASAAVAVGAGSAVGSGEMLACINEKTGERSFIESDDKAVWDYIYQVGEWNTNKGSLYLPEASLATLKSSITCKRVDGSEVDGLRCGFCRSVSFNQHSCAECSENDAQHDGAAWDTNQEVEVARGSNCKVGGDYGYGTSIAQCKTIDGPRQYEAGRYYSSGPAYFRTCLMKDDQKYADDIERHEKDIQRHNDKIEAYTKKDAVVDGAYAHTSESSSLLGCVDEKSGERVIIGKVDKPFFDYMYEIGEWNTQVNPRYGYQSNRVIFWWEKYQSSISCNGIDADKVKDLYCSSCDGTKFEMFFVDQCSANDARHNHEAFEDNHKKVVAEGGKPEGCRLGGDSSFGETVSECKSRRVPLSRAGYNTGGAINIWYRKCNIRSTKKDQEKEQKEMDKLTTIVDALKKDRAIVDRIFGNVIVGVVSNLVENTLATFV